MNTQHSEHARADELILLLKVDISFIVHMYRKVWPWNK